MGQLLTSHPRVTQSESHWSTQTTMQDYVRRIIDPFVKGKIKEHKLHADNNHALLLIDVWKVHKSQEFRSWMAANYPHYHIVFIPAGCTGVIQPADVLLQRPLKHEFSNQFTSWSTDQMMKQLQENVDPVDVKLNTDLGTLKPLVLQWILGAVTKLKHWSAQTMIVEGWKKLGLDKILDAEFQVQALKLVATKKLDIETVESGEEQSCQSASDEYVEEEEEGEAHDEEEDGDVDTALAACMEHRCEVVEESRRRSSRLQVTQQERHDRRIAFLLEEQSLNDTCYLSD